MPLCVAVAAEKHAYTEWVQWKKKVRKVPVHLHLLSQFWSIM